MIKRIAKVVFCWLIASLFAVVVSFLAGLLFPFEVALVFAVLFGVLCGCGGMTLGLIWAEVY